MATPVAAHATPPSHCCELVLGGQPSGKLRSAEDKAQSRLAQSPLHRSLRHYDDRARRVPGMAAVDAPLHLADAVMAPSNVPTRVVVDCLT